MPSTTLGGKWKGVSKTKIFGGESYRIYEKSRGPLAYSTKTSAERVANTLRENGWNVRLYELPSWSGRYVLYTRRE